MYSTCHRAPNNYELKPVPNDSKGTKVDNDGPETSEKASVEINLETRVELKRELGLPGGISFIVGAIIGKTCYIGSLGSFCFTAGEINDHAILALQGIICSRVL